MFDGSPASLLAIDTAAFMIPDRSDLHPVNHR
jgi:hypothetical protein